MRLIDKDVALRAVEHDSESYYEISMIPTVDPIIHAYWRDTKFSYGECSECGEWTDHYTTARYCVHCGARMDVVKI